MFIMLVVISWCFLRVVSLSPFLLLSAVTLPHLDSQAIFISLWCSKTQIWCCCSSAQSLPRLPLLGCFDSWLGLRGSLHPCPIPQKNVGLSSSSKQDLSCTWDCGWGKSPWKTLMLCLIKSNIRLFCDPAPLLWGVYRPRNPCTVLTATEEKRQQQRSSMGEHPYTSRVVCVGWRIHTNEWGLRVSA